MRRAADLSTPRATGISLGLHYDPEAFGRFSEAIARTMGTARFLVAQTVLVVFWIALNGAAAALRFDPYPFILLNLFLSMLAAIQAPVIMMSQNRQDAKDRIHSELDYNVNLKAELEILQRHEKVDALRQEILTRLEKG